MQTDRCERPGARHDGPSAAPLETLKRHRADRRPDSSSIARLRKLSLILYLVPRRCATPPRRIYAGARDRAFPVFCLARGGLDPRGHLVGRDDWPLSSCRGIPGCSPGDGRPTKPAGSCARRTQHAGISIAQTGHMKPRDPRRKPAERQPVPEGRDTPVMGPPKIRRKVWPVKGRPGVARLYDPGTDKRRPTDAWQDPGGAEPANG
jgi:hypothetical protein